METDIASMSFVEVGMGSEQATQVDSRSWKKQK